MSVSEVAPERRHVPKGKPRVARRSGKSQLCGVLCRLFKYHISEVNLPKQNG